jgi:hypothetical protein
MEEHMHSMTFCRGLLYAAASLFIGIPATSQVNTEIPKSPAQHIRITRFVDDPSLGNPFPSPELEPLRKAAFTIHNDDDREVVALCVIWQVTNTLGKTSTITLTMDEYLSTVPSVGIAPHGKLSMAPSGFLMPQQGIIVGAAGGRSDARLATRLADAQSVTVWVDSIIYADGTLWGPNTYAFDKSLTGRKAAAIHIAQVARRAMAHNEDPIHVLKPFATGFDSSNHQAEWEQKFANDLLANPPQMESLLQYLESLPSPPTIKLQQ